MNRFRALDLFCGAGGWAFAARGLPIEFVAVADIAGDCLETWRINHSGRHPHCRMIECDVSSAVDVLARLDVDVVLGGIPCAEISILRREKAPQEVIDAWHALLDSCIAIVGSLSPAFWCFEDVIQIEKHLPMPLFHGSEIPVWRCDASLFGPQRRVRSFIGEFPRPGSPPAGRRRQVTADCVLPGPHLTIPKADLYDRLSYPGRPITLRAGEKTARVLSLDSPSPTVVSSGPHRGMRQRRNWMVEDHFGRLRILDWREMARLQGFPEDSLFACGMCRAAEMVGQAIPIYVGRVILEAMVQELRARENQRETETPS